VSVGDEDIEHVLQIRPRRRVELLDEQRRQLQDEIGKVRAQLDHNQEKQTMQLGQVRASHGEQQSCAEKICEKPLFGIHFQGNTAFYIFSNKLKM
jgi:hypothetical protein